MRRFLLRSLLFVACAIAVLFAMWIPFAVVANRCMKIDGDRHILFLGNSHVECAVNDSIVGNCYNFARGMENMEYVYDKLKLLCRSNDIDTVYIGLDSSLLSVSSPKGIMMLSNPMLLNENTAEDWWEIIKTEGVFKSLHVRFRWSYDFKRYSILYHLIKTNDVKNSKLGGYLHLVRDKLQEDIDGWDKRINIRSGGRLKPKTMDDIGKSSIYFLDRIVDYCRANGIVLCFMAPPQHKLSPEDMDICHLLHRQRYSDIPFLDFCNMSLPDSCFGDLGHLNYRGAKVFSEYLEKEVIHKNNYPSSKMQDAVIN